jgi:protein TonB
LTANEPAPPGGEAAAAPEPAVASSGNDAATPVDRAPLAPAMPKVAAAGPPQPTASERRVEAAPRPPEAHGLMRDVPPPPAKPKLREAADDKLDGLRGLATPAGGPLAEAVAAGGQMARAIDRGKSDASDEPSDAYAIPHGNPPPAYPDLARRRGWEGRVVLRVTVDATGRAAAVAVGSTSGHAVLDAAAAAAVRNWRFEPARLAGVPVIAAVDVPVSFRLTD